MITTILTYLIVPPCLAFSSQQLFFSGELDIISETVELTVRVPDMGRKIILNFASRKERTMGHHTGCSDILKVNLLHTLLYITQTNAYSLLGG